MNGYHEVKAFTFASGLGNGVAMPEGWKPFAAVLIPYGGVKILARKWVRNDDPSR